MRMLVSDRELRAKGASVFEAGAAQRVRELDGLRAVAVLFVFVSHTFPEIFPGGFVGVDLFLP